MVPRWESGDPVEPEKISTLELLQTVGVACGGCGMQWVWHVVGVACGGCGV